MQRLQQRRTLALALEPCSASGEDVVIFVLVEEYLVRIHIVTVQSTELQSPRNVGSGYGGIDAGKASVGLK